MLARSAFLWGSSGAASITLVRARTNASAIRFRRAVLSHGLSPRKPGAATLAWLSYGDAAREMIASSSPQLGWLAPQAAPVAQTAPNMIAPAAPTAPSPDRQQLNAMSLSLAALRQSVDQLAAGQEQMTRDITKLRAAEQDILDKITAPPPRPAAAPARKPVPLTPSPLER